MSAADVLEKIFSLTSTVDTLKSDLDRLTGLCEDLHERVIRLEGESELTIEKSKNAAFQQVADMHAQMIERVIELEHELRYLSNDAALKDALPSSSASTDPDPRNA